MFSTSRTADISQLRVVVGEHNRSNSEVSKMTFEVEHFFVHPLYRVGKYLNNDIALIRLKRSIPFCREVAPVCLPEANVSPGTICVSTGWGDTRGEYDIRGKRSYFVIL